MFLLCKNSGCSRGVAATPPFLGVLEGGGAILAWQGQGGVAPELELDTYIYMCTQCYFVALEVRLVAELSVFHGSSHPPMRERMWQSNQPHRQRRRQSIQTLELRWAMTLPSCAMMLHRFSDYSKN